MTEAVVYWRDSWNAALEEAKKANRPLVLELYMEGCPHCKQLHRETHADPAVAAALEHPLHSGAPGRATTHGRGETVQRHRGAHHHHCLA